MEDPDNKAFDQSVNEYSDTLDAYLRAGGYEFGQAAGEFLMGLGLDAADLEKPLAQLSSGQWPRVELVRLLLQPTDFPMLDEPTNHLDIEGQKWLEDYINRHQGTVLLVALGRRFLGQTVPRILELRRGQLPWYTGIYSDYTTTRKQGEEITWKTSERAAKEAQRLPATVGERKRMARKVQGNKATAGGGVDFYARKASKVMKRAKVIERKGAQQLEKQKTANPFVEKQTVLDFPAMEASSAVVINTIGISKRFGDLTLFSDTTFSVNRGQHAAITGRNGSRKTTLARILLGDLDANRREIHKGSRVRIGYYGQEQEGLNPDRTILEEAKFVGPVDETWARMALGALLLRRDKVQDRVGVLSMGERSASLWPSYCFPALICWCWMSRPTISTLMQELLWKKPWKIIPVPSYLSLMIVGSLNIWLIRS